MPILIVIAIAVLLLLVPIIIYNTLIAKKNMVLNVFATIDALLKNVSPFGLNNRSGGLKNVIFRRKVAQCKVRHIIQIRAVY